MKAFYYTIFVICSFLFGVFCGFIYFDMLYLRFFVVFILIVVVSYFLIGKLFLIRYIVICFVFFLLGFVLILFSFKISKDDVSQYAGDITLCGVIDRDVLITKRGLKSSMNVFEIGGVLNDVGVIEYAHVFGRVLIISDNYNIRYGDELCLYGKLSLSEPFNEFRYDRFLLRYGITAIFEVQSLDNYFDVDLSFFYKFKLFLFDKIFTLKHFMERRLDLLFCSPYSGFVAGLLFGSRGGLPDDLLADFSAIGLTHIIAISGYNITILILIIGKLFSFVSFRIKFFLSNLFIFLFVILVGAEASVVRAGIMGSISLFAILFHRSYLALLALFLSAFLMVFLNPLILIYDVGFQLSVLATFGLIVYGNWFTEKLMFLPEIFSIRESMAMTLSAQVFVLPIIIFNFGKLSLISPFANVFVLPFLPYIMMFGFIALISSFIVMPIGLFFTFITYLFLVCVIFFVNVFASFDFALINMPNLSFWIFFIYYYLFYLYFLIKIRVMPQV